MVSSKNDWDSNPLLFFKISFFKGNLVLQAQFVGSVNTPVVTLKTDLSSQSERLARKKPNFVLTEREDVS